MPLVTIRLNRFRRWEPRADGGPDVAAGVTDAPLHAPVIVQAEVTPQELIALRQAGAEACVVLVGSVQGAV